MIDGTHVSETEHGLIRVFQGSYHLSMEIGHLGTYDMLCDALGIERIGHNDVQTLSKDSLAGMTLCQFLLDAYEVDEDDIAPYKAALDRMDGMILIIRSSAFRDRPATLTLNEHLTLVATLKEPGTATKVLPPIMTKSAEGILTPPAKKTPSDAAMGGRIATIALIVMGLLVWLMIKIAG